MPTPALEPDVRRIVDRAEDYLFSCLSVLVASPAICGTTSVPVGFKTSVLAKQCVPPKNDDKTAGYFPRKSQLRPSLRRRRRPKSDNHLKIFQHFSNPPPFTQDFLLESFRSNSFVQHFLLRFRRKLAFQVSDEHRGDRSAFLEIQFSVPISLLVCDRATEEFLVLSEITLSCLSFSESSAVAERSFSHYSGSLTVGGVNGAASDGTYSTAAFSS